MKNDELFVINNIDFKYKNSDYIIKNFSYSFNKTGFYTLFGNSGCGKTTLLNIISGILNFENGNILFNGKKYIGCVNKNEVFDYAYYITQESYFIDYLTVYEIVSLCSNDDKKIFQLFTLFKLTNSKDKYPNQLSGGEKQRLSIIIALLKNKKILILDEPTAELDIENKKMIFKILKILKKHILIICSSHDMEILKYCDKVIYFDNHLSNYEFKKEKINTNILLKKNFENYRVKNIYNFIKKQNNMKKNRMVNNLLIIIFVLSILISFFCFSIETKVLNTVQNYYKINYLTMYCPLNNKCKEIFDRNDTLDYVFSYSLNVPIPEHKNESTYVNIDFLTNIITLPPKKSEFPLSNIIAYGDYPDNENEIVLGYDLAKEYNYNIERLIGSKINIKLVDGYNSFYVKGILKKFDKNDKQYFKNAEVQIENLDNSYFINGIFNNKYINDEFVGYNEENLDKSVYYVYFKNFDSLYNAYKQYKNNTPYDNNIYVKDFPNQYLDILRQFETYAMFFLPIFILSIFISIVFYYRVQEIQQLYTDKYFSIYQLYGYNLNEIKKAIIKNNIINLVKCFLKSITISVIIAVIINFLNTKFSIIHYQIFSINLLGIVILIFFLTLISTIFSFKLYPYS